MHFDDRLATVLRLPDSSEGLARIQFRQLVDILGRLPGGAQSPLLEDGFARIAALAARIAPADRARLLRQPLQPIANPRLIALLAQDRPEVACAAIESARLAEPDWLDLIPRLPVQARGILRHRRDLPPAVNALLETLGIHDRGLPAADWAAPAAEAPKVGTDPAPGTAASDTEEPHTSPAVVELLDLAETPAAPTSLSEWARARAALHQQRAQQREAANQTGGPDAGIGAIVRRIEEFRRTRGTFAAPDTGGEAPRLPLGDSPPAKIRPAPAIDFATDLAGRISWADGPHAGALVGLNLAPAGDPDSAMQAIATTIRHRLPLRAERLHLRGAPAVEGTWQVDAIPQFDSATGRFTGYVGRLRRPKPAADAPRQPSGEADRMRQVLHELRTPANAIQVAAEIIQQQLYGPAPHEYRALAAAIAGDCAHVLAGFEELERLARLESGAMVLEPGECDLAPVLVQTIERLRTWTDPRDAGFALPEPATALPISLDVADVERLVWRLFAALAGSAAPGERMDIGWSTRSATVVVDVALPAALADRPAAALYELPPADRTASITGGMFGIGFTLRLASAEAAAAGGSLDFRDGRLHLVLPAAPGVPAESRTAAGS